MTYPPQPGQPYGQDPQGQQPGGYPQQPYPQQGGWDGGAQQQQAWDPNNPAYTQGFGGPPAPPPKSKTGLIIGIVIGVVVLIAFGVTGFVAPGFLLSKDDNNTAAQPPASSSGKAPASAPKSGPKSSASSKKSTESGGSSGSEGNPKGIQALKDFIAKVSAGDKAGALSLVCADMKGTMSDSIDLMAPAPSKLEVTTTGGIGDGFVTGDITGTVKGKEVTGSGISSDDNPDKSFCVRNFYVF